MQWWLLFNLLGRAKWTNRYRDVNTPLATQSPYGQSNNARTANTNYTNGSGYGGGGYGNNFNNYSNGATNYPNGTFGNGQNYQTKGYNNELKNATYQSGTGSIPRNVQKFQNPQYQTQQYNGNAGQKYGQSQVEYYSYF